MSLPTTVTSNQRMTKQRRKMEQIRKLNTNETALRTKQVGPTESKRLERKGQAKENVVAMSSMALVKNHEQKDEVKSGSVHPMELVLHQNRPALRKRQHQQVYQQIGKQNQIVYEELRKQNLQLQELQKQNRELHQQLQMQSLQIQELQNYNKRQQIPPLKQPKLELNSQRLKYQVKQEVPEQIQSSNDLELPNQNHPTVFPDSLTDQLNPQWSESLSLEQTLLVPAPTDSSSSQTLKKNPIVGPNPYVLLYDIMRVRSDLADQSCYPNGNGKVLSSIISEASPADEGVSQPNQPSPPGPTPLIKTTVQCDQQSSHDVPALPSDLSYLTSGDKGAIVSRNCFVLLQDIMLLRSDRQHDERSLTLVTQPKELPPNPARRCTRSRRSISNELTLSPASKIAIVNSKQDSVAISKKDSGVNTEIEGANPRRCEPPALRLRKDNKEHLSCKSTAKVFECSFCDFSCNASNNLATHERIHTGEKPYHCHKCPKSFTQKANLSHHLRVHINYKPYKCSYCDFRTKQPANLQAHERLHTRERPYKCRYCPKDFAQLTNVRSHERSFHCKGCL